MEKNAVLTQIVAISLLWFSCNDEKIEEIDSSSNISFSSSERTGDESLTEVNIPVSLPISFDQDVSIDYVVSGTASEGLDYVVEINSITISAGQALGVIEFMIIDDGIYEGIEETVIFELTGSNIEGLTLDEEGTFIFTYTIIDNDPRVTFNFNDSTDTGFENEVSDLSIPFTLSRSLTTDVAFNYTVTGTATDGQDYSFDSDTVIIPAGKLAGTINLTVLDDSELEGVDETIIITVDNSDSPETDLDELPVFTYTLQDDELPATLEFTSSTFQGSEDVAGSLDFSLSRALEANVEVTFEISGTATNPDDYTVPSTTITLTAGSVSGSITFDVVDDAIYDGGETVTVKASSSSTSELDLANQPEALYTILDNEIEIFIEWDTGDNLSLNFYDPDDFDPFIITDIGTQSEMYLAPSTLVDDTNWTVWVRPSADTSGGVSYSAEARLPDGTILLKEGTQALTAAGGLFLFNVIKEGSNWTVRAF